MRIFKALCLSLLAVCCACPLSSSASEPAKIVIQCRAKEADVPGLLVPKGEVFELSDDAQFRIRALVEQKHEKQSKLTPVHEFELPEQDLVCSGAPVAGHAEFDLSDNPIEVDRDTILNLQWNQVQARPGPSLRLETEITPLVGGDQESRAPETFVTEYAAVDQVANDALVLDMKTALFERKSRLYLVRRELGLPDSRTWKFSYDGDKLIIQRRISLPLSDVGIVTLECMSDVVPTLIQFSVDANGLGGRDLFILDHQIRRNVSWKAGTTSVELDLRPAFRDLNLNLERARLMEIIVFLDADLDRLQSDQGIKAIRFQKPLLQTLNNDFSYVLSTQTERSLNLNFGQAMRSRWEDGKVRRGLLTKITADSRLGDVQFVRWRHLRVLKTMTSDRPTLLQLPTKALGQWIPLYPGDKVLSFRPLAWLERHTRANPDYILHKDKLTFEIQSDKDPTKTREQSWLSDDPVIRSQAVSSAETRSQANYSAVVDYSSGDGRRQAVLQYLYPQRSMVSPPLRPGDRIFGLTTGAPEHASGLFDITGYSGDAPDTTRMSWWVRDGQLPFVPVSGKALLDTHRGQLNLMAFGPGPHEWVLRLDPARYFLPQAVVFPEGPPPHCRTAVRIGDHEIPLTWEKNIPLDPWMGDLTDISITIRYDGPPRLISLLSPQAEVRGLLVTPDTVFSRLRLLVDGSPLGIGGSYPTKPRQWYDLGSMRLDKGKHSLSFEDNDAFGILKVELTTDQALLVTPGEDDHPLRTLHRRWPLAFYLAVLLALLAAGSMFNRRLRSRVAAAGRLLHTAYAFIPDGLMALVWGLLGAWAYALWLAVPTDGQDYRNAWGALAFALSAWHASSMLRPALSKLAPALSRLAFASAASRLLALTMVMLVPTAVFKALRLDPVSQQTGLIMFFFFVAASTALVVKWSTRRER